MKIPRNTAFFAAFAVFVAFGAGWMLNSRFDSAGTSRSIRENSSEYQYINPLLFNEDGSDPSPALASLKKLLSSQASQFIQSGQATRVSAYYRDLNAGQWTGVNENDEFAPSSMLKVLTMVTYLHLAEDNSSLLLTTAHYRYQDDPGQSFKPKPLPEGDYPLVKLIEQTVVQSDNSANTVLSNLRVNDILKTYQDLRFDDPLAAPENFLSPKEYSRLFRILYNSSYTSRGYSEQALKLLTYTDFSAGLVAGVPSSTPVAHKFGEHTHAENGAAASRQLHDCGVIYAPGKPYVLCVMTEGTDFSQLESVLSSMSKAVYQYVVRQ